MTNSNLLEIAKGKGNAPFLSWFRQRLGNAKLDPTRPLYQPGETFEVIGVHARSYQTWEQIEDYPVRQPIRSGGAKTSARLYTKQQFVDIAYWHYLRKIAEEDASVLTVKDVAKRLDLPTPAIIQMMRAGVMPGTGQSVARDEFTTWLHQKLGVLA